MNLQALKVALRYEADTGRFFWLAPPRNHAGLRGAEAGVSVENRGGKSYWVVKIGGKAYKRARLAFFFTEGRWPHPCVDHINGDSLDDRAANLREATHLENARNVSGFKKANAHLPMGVRLTRHGRYQARLQVEAKTLYLGTFATVDEARIAYQRARVENFGAFA